MKNTSGPVPPLPRLQVSPRTLAELVDFSHFFTVSETKITEKRHRTSPFYHPKTHQKRHFRHFTIKKAIKKQ